MTIHYFKENDRVPPQRATIRDEWKPYDLTSAARIVAHVAQIEPIRRTVFRGAVDPISPGEGIVPLPGLAEAIEGADAGDVFAAEFEISWGDRLVETVPNGPPERIVIVEEDPPALPRWQRIARGMA